jgi:hypothetical protein
VVVLASTSGAPGPLATSGTPSAVDRPDPVYVSGSGLVAQHAHLDDVLGRGARRQYRPVAWPCRMATSPGSMMLPGLVGLVAVNCSGGVLPSPAPT